MLRSMIFKNFVHYHKYQAVEFNDGFNLIIGRNGCGKSVIFELIRRCMSTRISTTIPSTCGDEGEPAFAVCRYTDLTGSPCELLTGIFMSSEGYYVKFILHKVSDRLQCCADKYSYKSVEGGMKSINELLATKENEQITDANFFENYVKHGTTPMLENGSYVEEEILRICEVPELPSKLNLKSVCEQMLIRLEENFVATFPMRSIGPSQWTKSDRLKPDCRVGNEADVNKKAEIIQAFLIEKVEKYDESAFRNTLDKLTFPNEYTVTVDLDTCKIIINERSLLRAPEGIVEAIQFALIFASENYKTVCLEEPDRGMHSEMAERLRELIFSSKNKVFLLISHNISFVTRWTVPKTHVCVSEEGVRKSHTVVSLKKMDDTTQINRSFKLLTDTDNLKKVLFSSRILCVEGKDDRIVIEGIFDCLMQNIDNETFKKQMKLSTEEVRFVTSHQVIEFCSGTSEENMRNCCNALNISCTFFLDLDAYVEITQKQKKKMYGIEIEQIKFPDKEKFKHFTTLDSFVADHEKGLNELIRLKEIDRAFIWKDGRIEELILKSLSDTEFKGVFGNNSGIEHPLPGLKFASPKSKEKFQKFILAGDNNSTLFEILISKEEVKRFLEFMKLK